MLSRLMVFLFITLFALLFVASYGFGLPGTRWGRIMNVGAQAGFAASLLLFFLAPRRKKPPVGPPQ